MENDFKKKSIFSGKKSIFSGRNNYDTCKAEVVGDIMREFKNKKLKMRNNKVIKDKKQAIAVALSMASSKCHYNKADAEYLIDKVDRDLSNKKKEIILSNIIETKDAISYLHLWRFKMPIFQQKK